jgi:DNA-binding protein Fis
MSGIELTLIK